MLRHLLCLTVFGIVILALGCSNPQNTTSPTGDPLPADISTEAYQQHEDTMNQLMAKGQLREALRPALEALLIAPGHSRPWERLSSLYIQLREDDRAIELFAKLGERFPQSASPKKYEAFHHFRIGNWDEALSAYQRAAELDPSDPDPPFRQGLIYQSTGAFDEALKAIDQAREIDPSNPLYHARLIRLYRITGNYQDAETTAQTALEKFPKNAELIHAMGVLELRSNRLTEAKERLIAAIQLNPNLREAHFDLAKVFHLMGDSLAAQRAERFARRLTYARDFKEVLGDEYAVDPSNLMPILDFAETELTIGNTQEADQWLERAKNLNADSPRFHGLAAELALLEGDTTTAFQELSKVPPSARRAYLEALVAIESGLKTEAKSLLMKAENTTNRGLLYRVGDVWLLLGDPAQTDQITMAAERLADDNE